MKALFWILALAALAVAVALAAGRNEGYVLVVWPPYRVELSLNVALAALALAFVAGYGALRALSAVLALPSEVGRYRHARRREKARRRLAEAFGHFFAGRHDEAETAAVAALEQGEEPVLAAIVAARAAHALRAYDRRDGYLARVVPAQEADRAAVAITVAECLIEQRQPAGALEALQRLARPHPAALRLELAAHQQADNWDEVLRLVDTLHARKVFDDAQAQALRRQALVEALRRRAADRTAFIETWERAPAAERRDRRVAVVAAQGFIALGEGERAQRLIEEALESEWDSDLVALYADCPGASLTRRIERAERWLKDHPQDTVLLLTLGRLCAAGELWGKAQSYLEASLAVEATHSAHLELARLHERLGDAAAAQRHVREGLELALPQLHAATGGRRRTPR